MTNGVKAVSYKQYSVVCQNGRIVPKDQMWIEVVPEYTATQQTESYDIDSLSNMKEYGSASKENFDDYIETLQNAGFTVKSQTALGSNNYALCQNRYATVYVSYLASTDAIRIYTEQAGHFKYPTAKPTYTDTYTPKMWQLRVDNINARQNGGMSYIWLLADGTFFVIDGGYATDTEADNLYNFLKSKTPNGGEPVISGWSFSHTHGDHIGAIKKFAPKYAELVDVKAFYYHFENSIPSSFTSATNYWPDAKHYGRLHTGMKVSLPGIDFNVIYTLEDLYKTGFDISLLNESTNNYCAVIRVDVTVNDVTQRVMYLGDIQTIATNCIKTLYGDELSDVVGSDIVQFAHHGYEGVDRELYDAIAAPVVIWPVNIVSTQESYGSVCNVFTRWGMSTKNITRTETDPVTGETVSTTFANKYIWNNASYVKKFILAGESEYQEFEFPYVYSGSKHPNVSELYQTLKPILVPNESIFEFT